MTRALDEAALPPDVTAVLRPFFHAVAATMLNGAAFTALSTGVICVVAAGLAALTASRPASLTVLIGWHLVASPILGGSFEAEGARESFGRSQGSRGG